MSLAAVGGEPLVTPGGGYLPPMVSYAQNFEDVMLRRALQDIDGGFYIDIGACDPVELSVTKAFYDAGWRGINVEPNPEFAQALTTARPRDVTLACAVSDQEASATFHVVEGTGLSRLSDHEPEAVARNAAPRRSITVQTRRLSSIWDEFATNICVDFLKIDAEGAEHAIVSSTDFSLYRPRIIVVEATEAFSQRAAWDRIEPLIIGADYLFAYFDGLNRFYVRREDAHRLEAFSLPPCLFDNFTPSTVIDLQSRIDELTAAFHHQGAFIALQRSRIESMRIDVLALAQSAFGQIAQGVDEVAAQAMGETASASDGAPA